MRWFFLVLIFPSFSWAQRASLNPELFFQPYGGQIAVTTSFLYSKAELSDTISGVVQTEDGEGKGGRIDLEYGLLSFLSTGVAFSYQNQLTNITSGTTVETQKREGQDDWEFNVKMILPLTKTRLYLGTSYLLSTANSQQNGLSFNRFSGGNTLKPYFGVQFPMGPLWIGFRGEWSLRDPRTLEVDGTATTELSGGDEMDAYASFEINGGDYVIGVGAGVFLKQQETTKTLATSAEQTTQSFEKTRALAYTRYSIGMFSILLRVDYFSTTDQEFLATHTRETGKEIEGEFSLRYIF